MQSSYNSKYKKPSRLKQLGLLLCMIPSLAQSQEEIIVFHNTENLFYPTNASLTMDDDYTIEGKKHWTFRKYNHKLNMLAKTYISIDENQMPALIGLCEVESDTVLEDLTKQTPLRKIGYKFLHYSSQDIRGIDVALMYDPKKFVIDTNFPMPLVSSKEKDRTRDVLYVKGKLNKLPINIYVVHAPSRRENNIKKELRKKIFNSIYEDILLKMQEGEENFLVMGDMNDNPWDESVIKGFHLEFFNKDNPQLLFNLMSGNKDKFGSYIYSGSLLSFDQFLVSKSIKERLVFDNDFTKNHVYNPEFLKEKDKKSRNNHPYSTYKSMKYMGGVSDHFPIIMRLKTN